MTFDNQTVANDKAFLAGIFGAEGCIGFSRQKSKRAFQWLFKIRMCDIEFIQSLAAHYGLGSVGIEKPSRKSKRNVANWRAYSKADVKQLLTWCLPFWKAASPTKWEQANALMEVLDHSELKRGVERRVGLSAERRERYSSIAIEIQRLKRRHYNKSGDELVAVIADEKRGTYKRVFDASGEPIVAKKYIKPTAEDINLMKSNIDFLTGYIIGDGSVSIDKISVGSSERRIADILAAVFGGAVYCHVFKGNEDRWRTHWIWNLGGKQAVFDWLAKYGHKLQFKRESVENAWVSRHCAMMDLSD